MMIVGESKTGEINSWSVGNPRLQLSNPREK
jgi:hypothetical protein